MGGVRTLRTRTALDAGAILDRTFAAIVIDWDGLSAARRPAQLRPVRQRIESLCEAGVHVAVVGAGDLTELERQLHARPSGPGGLLLGLNRGAELYEVGRTGPRLLLRRGASPQEIDALDKASELVVQTLIANGVKATATTLLNRRSVEIKCDGELEASPDAADDPAVSERLRQSNFTDRAELVRMATTLAQRVGLDEPRVMSDGEHLEIGLTDKSDSMLDIADALSGEGIGPGLVLLVGIYFGPYSMVQGSDSVLVPGVSRATIVSVGSEPEVPAGVLFVGGGQASLVRLLDEQLRRGRLMRVPGVDEDPAWILRETGTDSQLHRVNETLFTVGSGGFATRGSIEEPSPLSVPLTLAAGVYQGNGAEQRPLPGPGWTTLGLSPAPNEDIRVLDLRTGVLYREEIDGHGVPFRSLRLASLNLPGLVAMRAEAALSRLNPGPPIQPPRDVPSTQGTVGERQWMRVGGEGSGGIGAVAAQVVGRDGTRRTVERMAAYVADLRHQPALPGAHELIDLAQERGFDRVLAEHRAAWAARWETVDVRIPDDPEVERAVRFALFQLWCNTGRYDELAVGARGLSGGAYSGHVFWDADVFVLPALVTMDPKAAQAMITYRVRRLPAARVRAQLTGHAGARFPWESGSTGEDVTPSFGQLGGAPVPILTGLQEEHITADVAWAALQCAAWSGRLVTPSSPEWPLLIDTARYWTSRCRIAEDGSAHIDKVIGPDEYHECVDDNAFTNGMARWNLRAAADAADAAAELGSESRRWRQIAESIVDGYHADSGLYEQFAGYFDLEPLLIADYAQPPVAADVLFGRDRVAASQSIKQPDVLMLHHLIPEDVVPGSLPANLTFYGPRTAHGSSLSPATTAALLARAGRADEALEMLRLALAVDLKDINGTTATGLHVATLGGIWQAVLNGFAGARVDGRVLRLDPVLPTSWDHLEVRFRCLQRCVRVHVTPEVVEVHSDGPLWVQVANGMPRYVHGRTRFERLGEEGEGHE